jgi:phosphoribosylformimino-5-aminoimidazole carboxamide ribotide isomerase
MLVIPVIDLRRGQVVHARRGQRQAYRPIVSVLSPGSEPLPLARALCDHTASPRLYIADLDALAGEDVQAGLLRALLDALPGIELWLDAAFRDVADAQALTARLGAAGERVLPVFGSESLDSRAALERVAGLGRAVLSLDRRDGRELDAAGAWHTPALWPRDVIAMTLERVGADAGPDLDTLRRLQALSPATRFTGAGGIRSAADLDSAAAAGAHGWLVASALHDGRLGPAGGR